MNPAIDKLAKVLELEANRGFDNRAVMGGLDRILETWRQEAHLASLPDSVIDQVAACLRLYPQQGIAGRQEALRQSWEALRSIEPDLRPPPIADGATAAAQEAPNQPLRDHEGPKPSEDERPSGGRPAETEIGKPEPEAESPGPGQTSQPTPGHIRPRATAADPDASPALEAPLTTLSGIGPKSARTLAKLGLETLGDLLWYLPRRYDDYSQLKTINRLWYGEDVTIMGTVESANLRPIRSGRMKLVEVVVGDGTGSLRITWFNQPWILEKLRPGKAVVLSGRVDQYLGHLTLNNPEWEPLERQQLHTNRIVPVYPLTAGVTAKWLRRVISSVVSRLAPRVADPLPQSVRQAAGLIPLGEALGQIHFPDNWDRLHEAQHRLAFDEMFILQLAVLGQKRNWARLETRPLAVEQSWFDRLIASLPYQLTGAQQQALNAIRHDMADGHPMNRLLQGDVGSGKTAVAACAIGIALNCGGQAALMAPTSILAEQHYSTLKDLLVSAGGVSQSRLRLLIGATPEGEKQQIREGLRQGEIQAVVGTHALLEDPVEFQSLSLAVIDEQHRFGVEQRAELRAKGSNPHLLVMSATPIPRSLALTVYGDLELSIIDEMPAGRQAIETRALRPGERGRAYTFLHAQLEQGRQAFIIYPLIEESEKVDTKAAVDEFDHLQADILPDFRLALLHGRMRAEDKENVMAGFRAGKYDVLVSTSVVEVGVDIPNASVMLIEGANHFGLSQLHQFRGRVGRGEYKSYCLLIPDNVADTDNERLKAMESTNDGFKLAELDLEQRGPGDFLGTRQSGFAELRTANLTDIKLIEKARRLAKQVFEQDPELKTPDHALLAQVVAAFSRTRKGEIS
jgi:ATP-dependent DNA helicase RecG